MDFVKNAVHQYKEGHSGGQEQSQEQSQHQAKSEEKPSQDYGDKGECFTPWHNNPANTILTAFDFVSKKAGLNLNPMIEEKITDGIRTYYEKETG